MARPRKIQTPGETPADQPEPQPQAVEQEGKPSGLPRAADIDPKTITKAVLTQDGWVCPG